MTKKKLKEFDAWFKDEIERVIESSDILMPENDIAQIFKKLKSFVKAHPEFQVEKSEYSAHKEIVKKVDIAHYNRLLCRITLYFDLSEKYNNGFVEFFNSKNCHMGYTLRLNVIYSYLDFLVQYSEAFQKMLNLRKKVEDEKIKKERINTMQIGSTETWISNLMIDTTYPYKLKKSIGSRLTLCVKMTDREQIQIPILKKSFQKTIPQILETIKQYKDFIKKSKTKGVLIDCIFSNKDLVKDSKIKGVTINHIYLNDDVAWENTKSSVKK